MNEPANQSFEGAQEAHDEVFNFSLELSRYKIEYFDIAELKDEELLKVEQELTDKLVESVEVNKNLDNILSTSLKNQQEVKEPEKKDETFIRINGLYHCPECLFETKSVRRVLKLHINVVHRKLKPFNCSECTKGKRIKTYHLKYFIK